MFSQTVQLDFKKALNILHIINYIFYNFMYPFFCFLISSMLSPKWRDSYVQTLVSKDDYEERHIPQNVDTLMWVFVWFGN